MFFCNRVKALFTFLYSPSLAFCFSVSKLSACACPVSSRKPHRTMSSFLWIPAVRWYYLCSGCHHITFQSGLLHCRSSHANGTTRSVLCTATLLVQAFIAPVSFIYIFAIIFMILWLISAFLTSLWASLRSGTLSGFAHSESISHP